MSKVWFVTGSSRGLGRAIVDYALGKGEHVVATARTPAQLDDLKAQYGDQVHLVALDVSDAEQIENAITEGLQQFGQIDIVVNNAGYGDVASVEDVTEDDFRRQIETNFLGVVNVTKAVLPHLRAQGHGHIFQVSSLGGRIASVGLAAYQSAKWAVGGFSSVLAQEIAPLGVKVTVLEPGGMPTDWAGSSMAIPPISPPYQQTVGQFAAMLRGEVELPPEANVAPADLQRIASVIAELAERDDAPVRLLLGADAVNYAGAAASAQAESDAQWRAMSLSVTPSEATPPGC